jgi:anthranilate 1,2-dioxygenase (deaminating, decarboxylating) small subunit
MRSIANIGFRPGRLLPLPRTTHVVSNILPLEPPQRDRIRLRSSWACHTFFPLMDVHHTFFGRAEYDLARRDENWLIAKKKTILENDRIPLPIDIYCL